jgi:hypothetical protein
LFVEWQNRISSDEAVLEAMEENLKVGFVFWLLFGLLLQHSACDK